MDIKKIEKPTLKQLNYARSLAYKNGALLPWDVQNNKAKITKWITKQVRAVAICTTPSAKQLNYAKFICRKKKTKLPEYCYSNRDELSRWINKHPI